MTQTQHLEEKLEKLRADWKNAETQEERSTILFEARQVEQLLKAEEEKEKKKKRFEEFLKNPKILSKKI